MAEIAIVGRACRLPGASSPTQLWDLLREGRCAVTQIPPDRWSLERLGHPRQSERGRSYTWAAGVLDDIWGFDAAAFGLSPREAEQMDPQQRLLLELTWEALEDAGIRPSTLAGSETGVFVGASTNDHGTMKVFDLAATDAYFATGNAASVLSNRISYVFDLNGPSFTVDTACSSSLVALDAAVQALRSGRVDTAIVGGVSILTGPFAFINFSQASMLSRIGLCQTFSAKADGYVRSEGAGILVLQTTEAARAAGLRTYSRILATRINSDGRTNGIALPSKKKQAQLLDQLYRREGIDPGQLAFVEAHGTGTPVGDPIEAAALGETLGQRRDAPLPVGSIKSNIGHTEAAAGIAGVLKASLALEHDLLPPSLHCPELNPHIDFDRLNLLVARAALPLPRGDSPRLAGISSYGFGGTNSHVVIADPVPEATTRPAAPASSLVLSARSRAALAALAHAYADRIEAGPESAGVIASAANHRRDRMDERLIVDLDKPDEVPTRLRAFAAQPEESGDGYAAATALPGHPAVAFVFSGNGGQWVGMGRAAYARHPGFRARFDEADAVFEPLAGWSLAAMLHGGALAEEIGKTSVAQPLIFAIQAASTAALRGLGLRPAMVFGHSVGEVAAAEAAGVFDLETAVRLIYFRSLHQERVHAAGGMTVLIGSAEAAREIEATVPEASIAAFNSPRAFTFSGTAAGMEAVASAARGLKARAQKLDIAYPFHSPLIELIKGPLLDSLGAMTPAAARVPFISTVTGGALPGTELDAGYWWRNIREPVLFSAAIEEASRQGARIFVEIGPSAILLSHVKDTLAGADIPLATVAVLDRKDAADDPFGRAVAEVVARGAASADAAGLGDDPGPGVALPTYPWQRKLSRLGDTADALPVVAPGPFHPLIGARYTADELEWHGQIDTALLPALADHVVDSHVLLPGAAFVEMALAVARDWLKSATASVADFEIQAPMILAGTASRDVRCRVQPATGLVEIMSRPRLTQAAWQVHASAKILRHQTDAMPPVTVPSADGQDGGAVEGATVYALAKASGLAYGPAFQLLRSARRVGPRTIAVELIETAAQADGMGLDPACVDSCFHGLALLYRELAAHGRLKPYVPVGAGEIRLLQPGVAIVGALVEVVRSDDRTIVVDFTLLDASGGVVATLRRARFQAMNAFRAAERSVEAIVSETVLATEPLAVPASPMPGAETLLAAAAALDAIADDEAPSPAFVLLDGWATAAAFGLAEELCDDGRLDPVALVATGRLPGHLEPWLRRLLVGLRQSGLATTDVSGVFTLLSGIDLPDPADILRALAADHPERSAELLLAARTGALVDAVAAGRYDRSRPITTTALDSFELGGIATTAAAEMLAAVVAHTAAGWPGDRRLRLLQLGDGPLTARALAIAERHGASLTLVEPDRRRLERARLSFGRNAALAFEESLAALPVNGFDLVLGVQSGRRLLAEPSAADSLAATMTPGAVVALVEAAPSVFRDLVFGLQSGMAGDARNVSDGGTERMWRDLLEDAGLTVGGIERTRGTDFAWLVLGEKPAERAPRTAKGETLVIGRGGGRLEGTAEALAVMLRFSGFRVASLTGAEPLAGSHFEGGDAVVYLAEVSGRGTPAERLMSRCRDLKALAAAIGPRKTLLWVVCPGATRATGGDPVEAGVWAFCRTLANETATLDVRLIDLHPDLDAEVASRRLRDVILSDTDEREIVLDAEQTSVVRFGRLATEDGPSIPPDDAVLRLIKGDHASGLDRLQWQRETRVQPGPGEVEIAVESAGLNFRDVMWGLSILPEEILEDGFAGATLGLECAGRIVRVGPEVTDLAAGDTVLAFAKAALATHVTAPAAVDARRPPAFAADAAATIPVAFLTAFYGLIRCARLAEDEWVLIHGGAGGVGLAAIQIARWRGARVIATAGSPERRDLLTVLGAEHVFDSRSNGFVDDVRRVTGSGVDVVLNSLSGEAMERPIAVLRPFGRFVELGKRDYVANTHIGLKPFRRNLSYFGVDLDQLMLKDDTTGRELFAEVMGLLEAGSLVPLPFRSFGAGEVVEAFRVMQRSGHIGKIVIKPPPVASPAPIEDRPLAVSSSGTHLVTGGLGGFGLATARWLVDAGARHLVLVGRTGAASAAAKAGVAALQEAGATVEALALDITDEAAMEALFGRFGRDLPALLGVAHAATVFDDALIATMTDAKLAAVVGAKVSGAVLLDRLTRSLSLDYFLLFSSATTLIGNPGQGAYVAANAFLEGLARARRSAGLPALAVAWGAIEDVGVLTRSSAAATNLLNRSGVLGMAARQALDAMAAAARRLPDRPEAAVLAVAAVNWTAAREHLPVLRSRSFERLMHGAPQGESTGKGKINVRALFEERGREGAASVIVDTVLDEIARILRLPKEDVSRHKPLMDIGLDSLMAVELGMGLEDRFELDAPLSTSVGTMSIAELGDYIVGAVAEGKDQTPADVALRHFDPELQRDLAAALPELAAGEVPIGLAVLEKQH